MSESQRRAVVDVLTVLAPGERMHPDAEAALARQGCVDLRRHFAEGRRSASETRVATIARARNRVKTLGSAPFALFLDRDVVLPDRGVERLLFALYFNRGYGALGLNYQAEPSQRPAAHVAMGAVLFHRSVLDRLTFRTEPDRCECDCLCEDIRRLGYRIDYLPNLRAQHR